MDFSWTSTFNGFWFFPLLCLVFMALMMFACHGRSSGCGRCGRSADRRPDPNDQAPRPGAH